MLLTVASVSGVVVVVNDCVVKNSGGYIEHCNLA